MSASPQGPAASQDAAPRQALSVRPMGESALLVECATLAAVMALAEALREDPPEGIVEVVPAARTVLVRCDTTRLPLPAARAWIATVSERADACAPTLTAVDPVVLDVVYDGPDIATTAETLGVSVDALVRAHTGATWRVAFTGFAPGFAYVASAEWPFAVPRLASPRTRVPAGSLGLAGEFSGVYPRESPGGWQLIGRTDAVMFDPDAASPALLVPGDVVRYRPRHDRVAARPVKAASVGVDAESVERSDAAAPAAAGTGIRIIEPGLLSTVQDLGRPGAAALGVSQSGALDRGALRTANRLVGNAETAAGIEITMGGLRARALTDTWFAVAGAWGAVHLDGAEVDPYTAHAWPAGSEVHLDWFDHGVRAYLAVRGGIDATRVLRSRATDVLSGLGPQSLAAGVELALTSETAGEVPVAPPPAWGAPHDDEITVDLAPGPRADWFTPAARSALYETVWTVSNRADRVGVQLEGAALERDRTGELPSEGMVPGAIQVPPDGQPVILLADGPVTGGYPVIAVAAAASLDLIAQARPGTRIRFRHARPAGARA